MKVTMMDNPGKADDVIRRETAINTVSEKEGWYPASLWYVPPAERWISIKERLPEQTTKVLVWVGIYNELGMFFEARTALYHIGNKCFYVDRDNSSVRGELLGDIAYWMPLPEPPKEKNNE